MHAHSSHSGIPVGPLLVVMTQQAEAESARIAADAQAEAARIAAHAQQEAEAARQRALREAEAEIATAAKRSRERVEAKAHMLVLTAKDTLASEILDRAAAELRAVASQQDFKAVIERLLAEAFVDVTGNVIVLAPTAHVDAVKAWLEANGRGETPVEASTAFDDGIAIQDAGQTYRITNTLSARFKRQEGDLRRVCLQQLFGGEN